MGLSFNSNFNNMYAMPQFNWNNWQQNNNVFMNNFMNSFTGVPTLWSTSSSSNNSYEDYKQQIIKKQEEKAQKELEYQESLKLKAKKNEVISSLEKQLTAENQNIENIKKSKNEDGTATIRTESKNTSFWQKAGRFAANAGTALLNLGKTLIGYDKNGKWQPMNALRNLGIAALCVAACACPALIPAAVPLIGGLSVGAVATAAGATIGVACGVAGAAKSSIDLANAKTDKEIDEAQQNLVTNTVVAALSVVGLKGIKNVGANANVTTTTASTTTAASATNVAKSGFFKNCYNSVVNVGKDIGKGVQKIADDDKLLLANNNNSVTKAMLAKARNSINNLNWTKQYENKLVEVENKLNSGINKLTNKIASEADDAMRQSLENQRSVLQNNLAELNRVKNFKTKTEFDDLLKDSSVTRDKSYLKDLKTIVEYKENAMRTLAGKPDKYLAELNEYLPTLTPAPTKWYNPTTWTKYTRANDYQYTIGGKNPSQFFKFTGYVNTTPVLSGNRVVAQLENPTSGPFLFAQELTKEEFDQTINGLVSQKTQLENQIKQITQMDDETFKNYLAQVEAEAQAQAQTQAPIATA